MKCLAVFSNTMKDYQSSLAGFNVWLDVCLGTHLVWTKMMA